MSESRVRENRTHGSMRRREATPDQSALGRAVQGRLPPTLQRGSPKSPPAREAGSRRHGRACRPEGSALRNVYRRDFSQRTVAVAAPKSIAPIAATGSILFEASGPLGPDSGFLAWKSCTRRSG